jgi:primosomal protein N'
VFTARNRQNAFAKRRREVREAQQVDAPPAEPTAVPYDTRNAESADVVDAPDVSTFAAGGVVFPPTEEQQAAADELLQLGQEVDPTPVAEPIPVELAPVISAETRAKVDAVLNHAIPSVADSVPVESEPAPEPAAAPAESEPKRGRGRPRPQETIDRDNAVHRLLTAADEVEGVSKEALAIALDEKEQQVYSSLRQLSKEGRAETRYVKGHGYRWFAL